MEEPSIGGERIGRTYQCRLRYWACRIFATGVAVFAAAELILVLTEAGAAGPHAILAGVYAAAACAALWLIANPFGRFAAIMVVIAGFGTVVDGMLEASSSGLSLVSLVPPAEGMLVTLVAFVLVTRGTGRREATAEAALWLAVGAALALFGLVHVYNAVALSAMIPGWFPGRSTLPFLTGSIMILAAIGISIRRSRWIAAAVVGSMFASWLPLIHAERIANDLADMGEWSFGGMAMALSGCLLFVSASSMPGRSRLPSPDPDRPIARPLRGV